MQRDLISEHALTEDVGDRSPLGKLYEHIAASG